MPGAEPAGHTTSYRTTTDTYSYPPASTSGDGSLAGVLMLLVFFGGITGLVVVMNLMGCFRGGYTAGTTFVPRE